MKWIVKCLFLLIHPAVFAQESSLDSSVLSAPEKISGAFKSTRVINAHSIEMLHKKDLDFRIMHRFGFVSDGLKQFFGLDDATMRMSLDYGITDNIMAGLGRSTFRKEVDVFIKTRLLQQAKGQKQIPLSVVMAIGAQNWTEETFGPVKPTFHDRMSYYIQLLAGRKFSDRISFQLSPILLISNSPVAQTDKEAMVALGAGGRVKVSKRVAITIDYHHLFRESTAFYTDPLSVGIDIETGGHVFQLHFSNATGTNERAYLSETRGDFFKGDIRFGFNLSRMFSLGKRW